MKKRNFPEGISIYSLWQSLYNCYRNKISVVGTIISYNEHFGYTVDIDGAHADMPKYELSYAYIDDFESYVGKTLLFRISNIDTYHKSLRVSRKRLASELKAGMATRGIVTEIIGNRMHVDVGFLARVNIRNMADSFVKDINAMFKTGQFVDIVLLEDYISAKYTEATSKPSEIWLARKQNLKKNTLLVVSVVGVSEVGLQVNISDYFDGFIHKNFLIEPLKERFDTNSIKIGEYIEVAVSNIIENDRKVLLSTLQVQEIKKQSAWRDFLSSINKDEIVTGIIEKVSEAKGIVLKINEFVSGYIPFHQISKNLQDDIESGNPLIGAKLEAAVISYSLSQYKLHLSISRITEIKEIKEWNEVFVDINVDSIFNATISEVKQSSLILKLGEYTECNMPFHFLSKNLKQRIENGENVLGECISVAVAKVDYAKRKIQVSMKRVAELAKIKAETELKSKIQRGNVISGVVVDVQRKYATVLINGTSVEVIIDREELSANKIVDACAEVYPGQEITIVYLGEDDGKMLFSRKPLTTSIYSHDLFSLTLKEILTRLGIEKNLFIGRAVKMGDDYFFHDVASVGNNFNGGTFFEGRLLQDLMTAQPSIVMVKNKNLALDLTENGYYEFSIALANQEVRVQQGSPFIYQTTPDFSIKPVENPYKKEVERVFAIPDSPETNRIIASLLREVGSQLYSEKSRMLFELLQNADDATPSRDQEEENNPQVQVSINIMKDVILFQHNGCAFNFEDFRSITSAANSTKGAKRKSTGYKGIGFKSVFTNSKSVFIHSKGFHFLFNRNDSIFDISNFDLLYRKVRNINSDSAAQEFFSKFADIRRNYKGVDDIPWQIMPFWDDSNRTSLIATSNDNVIIGLLMDSASRDEYSLAIQEVFDNPRMFLFLRHTRRLQFKSIRQSIPLTIQKDYDSEKRIITLTDSRDGNISESYKLFNATDIEISDCAFERAEIGIKIKCEEKNGIKEYSFIEITDGVEGKKVSNIPGKIASADSTVISLAFAVNKNNEITPINIKDIQSSLYAYLPLNEQRFKFPFFINADFVLSSSREGLQADNRWNVFLFYQIGSLIVDAVRSIAGTTNPKYLGLLPDIFDTNFAATSTISEAFNRSYIEALNTQKFILDEQEVLRSQSEIIIDKTGLSNIIGGDTFRTLIGTTKHLPYTNLDITPLSRSYFKLIESIDYEVINQYLINIENISVINDWITNPESDSESIDQFYDWIIKSRDLISIQNIVNNLKIVKVGNIFFSPIQLSESDVLILSNEAFAISDLLDKLQISCNSTDLSVHILSDFIKFSDDIDVYNKLVASDLSKLNYPERLRLFQTLDSLSGIGDFRLKNIPVFNSANGNLISLGKALLIPEGLILEQLPEWYNDYIVSEEEMCSSLTKYLPNTFKESFEVVFAEFIDNEITTIEDFYSFFSRNRVWDSSNTEKLIEKYRASEKILFIVEDSDNDRKKLYLNKLEQFNLLSDHLYNADSLEYRVLNMAISSGNSQLLRTKTYIDGRPLSQYVVSDIVTYHQNGITYKLQLADILPGFSSENALGQIKKMFSSINNVDDFFTQEEIDKKDLRSKFRDFLNGEYNYLNWSQIAYIVLEKNDSSTWGSIRTNMHTPQGEDLLNIFNSFIEHNWTDLLKIYFKEIVYLNLIDIQGKYFESDAYALPEERIPEYIACWLRSPELHEERTKLLLLLGAYSSTSNEIKRRKRFLGDSSSDADWSISGSAVTSFCNWIVKTQQLPISKVEQKQIIKTLADNAPKIIVKDFNELRLNEACEYDDECYIQWRATSPVSIYLINGEIPRVYKFDNIVLFSFEEGSVDYAAKGSKKIIYVNAKSDIETEMTVMAHQYGVPFSMDNWRELFSVNRSSLKKEQEENNRLQEENRRLREQLVEDIGKRHKPGDLDNEDQKELNRMARYRAKDYLLSHGYECEDWDPEISQAVYHTIKDGEEIAFAVTSCRGGLVYLHTYKFAILMGNPNNLLLIDDGNRIQSFSFKNAFQSNTNVNLIFDIDYIIPSSMAKIANMMQAFPKTRFVFEKPHYSISDEIYTFGLNEKHEGAAPIIESMDELD